MIFFLPCMEWAFGEVFHGVFGSLCRFIVYFKLENLGLQRVYRVQFIIGRK